MGEEAYEVIVSRLPKLVEKIPPEEISDDLLSLKIINEEQWQASFDVRELRKKRTRALIYAVMQAVKKDAKNFEGFCTVLKNSDKKATQDWGDRLRGEISVFYNDLWVSLTYMLSTVCNFLLTLWPHQVNLMLGSFLTNQMY